MSKSYDQNAMQRAQSRTRGRLRSEDYQSTESSHDGNTEVTQIKKNENKPIRKTTFQTVANNQENRVLIFYYIKNH